MDRAGASEEKSDLIMLDRGGQPGESGVVVLKKKKRKTRSTGMKGGFNWNRKDWRSGGTGLWSDRFGN